MSEVGKVSTSSFIRLPSARHHEQESGTEVRNGARALDSLLKFRDANKHESMEPDSQQEPQEETHNGAAALAGLLAFRNASHDQRMNPGYMPEPKEEVRNGATALDSLLEFRLSQGDERINLNYMPEPEEEVRNGATALDSLLEHRNAGKHEAMDPSQLPEEEEVRNGATALDSLLEHRNAGKHEAMDPSHLPEEEEVRNGATALDSLLEHRNAGKHEAMEPSHLPEEEEVRNGAKALDRLMQMRNERTSTTMTPTNQPESQPKVRIAASALESAMKSMDRSTDIESRKMQGRRLNLDPALEEHDTRRLSPSESAGGLAVSIMQDFKETAKRLQDNMLELEAFLNKALEDSAGEGQDTEFRNQLLQLIDAINLHSNHTLSDENPLLGEGGQDLKIAHGDGTVGVLAARDFSFSGEEVDLASGHGLETLLDRVRGRVSVIEVFQGRVEEQLRKLAMDDSQFSGRVAQDMGIDPAELNAASAAQLASEVAVQITGMTRVMMNMDLDHQAKRIAGLLRSPI